MARPTPISTKLHGVLDYLTGAQLIAAPEVIGLNGRGAMALRASGAAHAAYSAFTDYELGAVRAIPMRAHLVADAVGALVLAASPWMTGSAREGTKGWLPHVFFGVYELGAVALSDPGD